MWTGHQGVQEVSKVTRPDLDIASPALNSYISVYPILFNYYIVNVISLLLLFTS